MGIRAAGEPDVMSDDILQQMGQLLQERELASLLEGLRLVMRAGGGWGQLKIEIKAGHIDLVTPTISIKPGKEKEEE